MGKWRSVQVADVGWLVVSLPTQLSNATASHIAWQVETPSPDTVVFRAETPEAAVEKRYQADTDRYRLRLEVRVHNKTAKPQDHHLAVQVATRQDQNTKGGGFDPVPAPRALCQSEGR